MNYKKLLLIFACLVLLILLNFLFFKNYLDVLVQQISKPAIAYINKKFSFFADYTKSIINLNSIIAENSNLREDSHKLSNALAQIYDLREENASLRVRLGVGVRVSDYQILANIYSIRGDYNSSLMIDKGSRDGIEAGLAVVTAENSLVGIVDKVYENNALVLLPNNPNLKLDVKINERSVIAKSRGQGNDIYLDFVTSKDEVELGDLVVTAGFGQIPHGIPTFKISMVDLMGGGNLFKQIKVEPIFDILDTNKVFILK